MLERRVVEYLTRKERGTVRPVPESFQFARPDRPFSGRFVIPGVTPDDHPGLTYAEAEGRSDVAWVPPRLSTASRNISLKSMRSVRGHLVDAARNQVLMFESVLEFLFANMLMAQPDIVRIEDQPHELKFEMDGEKHGHTFDFRLTASNGFKGAYAVKPSDHLERDQTMRKMKALSVAHIPRFADEMRVVTERQVTRDKGWNAFDINEARRMRVQVECDNVLELLRGIGSRIEIWRLQEKMGDESSVWNAILCLQFDGLVEIATPGIRFTDAATVRAVTRH